MPKVTFTFDLPEEQHDFDLATNASKYYSVIWDLDQYLRNKSKYPEENTPEGFTEAMYQVRDELWKLINENGLLID